VTTAPGQLDSMQDALHLAILGVVKRYWGYDSLRPLQREAIEAGISRRDSLVVLPTGGGKSLCYQVPPLLHGESLGAGPGEHGEAEGESTARGGRMDVVVSPLIALMKDQVDALREADYPAAALHSGMDERERRAARELIQRGECRLLLVSPERITSSGFLDWLDRVGVGSFAIDEAHCISQWGHDFRPEYRQLAMLRDRFPNAGLHAYTATATPKVRDDIVTQLRLRNPLVLVGDFDRPNLVYRVLPKLSVERQVLDVLARHKGEAGIVYCISRKETESLAEGLRDAGLKAAAYHAGLGPKQRRDTQDQFSDESIDIVVATVAFGMGIDRGDVRCVIHAGIPKSVEAYQQESGRAGRDGLPAECVLLYSYSDVARWESLMGRSLDEALEREDLDGDSLQANHTAQLSLLREVQQLVSGARCRHAALCEHFGQRFTRGNCGACDVCLNEIDSLADGTTTARKILAAVARVEQRFGAMHVAKLLAGADDEALRRFGHHALSVFGLLRHLTQSEIVNLIHQLLDHGLLARSPGDRPILSLTSEGVALMRGAGDVVLRRPTVARKAKRAAVETRSWDGVDRALFDRLRELRRRLALERGVPPYVVFDDNTLRELSRVRPSDAEGFSRIRGVGARKLADNGPLFLAEIQSYCSAEGVAMDMH